MKVQIALLSLSLAVLLVMILQAARQELDLRNLKDRMAHTAGEIKQKEEAIVQLKDKIQTLRTTLTSSNTKMDQLKKKKQDIVKSTEDFEKSLQTCNTEKENAGKKKDSMTAGLEKLKAEHAVAKTKAEQEIQSLKQHILDRDKAICAFADTSIAEARKLCAVA